MTPAESVSSMRSTLLHTEFHISPRRVVKVDTCRFEPRTPFNRSDRPMYETAVHVPGVKGWTELVQTDNEQEAERNFTDAVLRHLTDQMKKLHEALSCAVFAAKIMNLRLETTEEGEDSSLPAVYLPGWKLDQVQAAAIRLSLPEKITEHPKHKGWFIIPLPAYCAQTRGKKRAEIVRRMVNILNENDVISEPYCASGE